MKRPRPVWALARDVVARDSDDLVLLLLIGAGVAVAFNLLRFSSSTAGGAATWGTGSPVFEPTAPTGSPIGDALNMVVPMKVSPNGRAFIQRNEGFNLNFYPDAGGQSIYWGHHVRAGETFTHTQDDAQRYFDSDIAAVESELNNALTAPVSQNQYDALADLVFNLSGGVAAMPSLIAAVNARDYAGAAALFAEYNHSGGQVSAALTSRRAADANLFGTGTPATAGTGGMVAANTGTTGSPYVG